jgi:hypothetical protein
MLTKLLSIVPLTLLALSTGACTTDDSALVSGTWQPSTVAQPDGDCDPSGYQDLVNITATDMNKVFLTQKVPCSDGRFDLAVPRGTVNLQITFQVIHDGPSAGAASTKVPGPIEQDVDLGHVTIRE